MRRLIAASFLFLAAGLVLAPTPADAGGGCHGGGEAPESADTVQLSMNCMNPRVLRSSTGAITFVNRDETTHNLFGDGWSVGELLPGKTYSHTFVPGTHVFACTIHPGMVGAVVVGDGVGTAAPIVDVSPVKTAATAKTTSDRLPLGLALGALAGVAATLGVRRYVTSDGNHAGPSR